MKTLFLPLVNWGMGTFIIGVFAVVCIVLIAVIYNLTRSGTAKGKGSSSDVKENETNTL